MGMKSVNKFLPTCYLVKLREDDYCNKDKGIDYAPCEVDALIYRRQDQQGVKNNKVKEREIYFIEISQLIEKKMKWCSDCKNDLPWDKFHKDKSKKLFKLRSHCKQCRKG